MLSVFQSMMVKAAENPLEKLEVDVPAMTRALHMFLDKLAHIGGILLYTLIVFVIAYAITAIIRKIIQKLLSSNRVDRSLRSFVNSTVNIAVKIFLLLVVLKALGVESASFAALIATLGLALGLAAKDNLSNFASGVMILFFKPFKVGDRVMLKAADGTVEAISFLFVTVKTLDGQILYIPNSKILNDTIYNYSEIDTRRLDLNYMITFGYDSETVISEIRHIIMANKTIETAPAPFIGVTDVRESNYTVTARVWVAQDHYGAIQGELNKAVFARLEAMGLYQSSILSVAMQSVEHKTPASEAQQKTPEKTAGTRGVSRSSRSKSVNKPTEEK